jgi:hypothetical protein
MPEEYQTMPERIIPFSSMKEQVSKKNVTHSPSKWVYPTENQTENEFQNSDEIPYGVTPSTPDATSFSTITKQVNKKRVSKKSKRDRIAERSVSLSERLGERV